MGAKLLLKGLKLGGQIAIMKIRDEIYKFIKVKRTEV
jgi:hypothetical protein